jgi:signal transduction histidine kinase
LHDAVTQTLFSASVLAQASPLMMKKNPAIAQQNFERLETLINGALAEMRSLLLELRPDRLREQDISQLISLLVESMRARTRANVSLYVEESCSPPEDVVIFMYRIAQEALNNVARHAMASEVIVELTGDDEDIELLIKDDGNGFDLREIPAGHFGVTIMQERAKSIGAKMEIVSSIGEGTQVFVSWSAPGKDNEHE